MIKVEDMMTRNPHTLLRTHTLRDAKSMMDALDIRHIPVVDANHHLQGLVTQRDILAAQESCLHPDDAEQSFTLDTPLYEMMHTNIMTAEPRAGLKESAIYMQKHKVGCLPIVHKGHLVGIITDTDFVTIAINLLELQEEVEPEEIEPEEIEPDEEAL
ncbi:CBS domain-containing protein [Vibrio parahaemolyticus]|uniref:CBS domain-containing protein n=1 Tax=Vibrio parahaemolyticus TaxID=670 RepID=UPI000411F76B|nr:CBS domain-containing protein [Vibrio parahaemolyticus]TOD44462.1 acetoin utilization protein AcuB [Vibrio parahaemolyticus]TON49274.1 acetoin utilization protein AcuB [Vibrio parahaemolyticus]